VQSASSGKTLTTAILRFARIMRLGGISVQTGDIVQATDALQLVGLSSREDVRQVLAAVWLRHRQDRALFNTLFDLYWRSPQANTRNKAAASNDTAADASGTQDPPSTASDRNKALAALMADPEGPEAALTSSEAKPADSADAVPPAGSPDSPDGHLIGLFGRDEQLRQADFAALNDIDIDRLRRELATLPYPIPPVLSRRLRPASTGRIDLALTLRRTLRAPDMMNPAYRRQSRVLPPLVMLIDISRSMERYSQAFLAYAHGLSQRFSRVHTLVFGTRLTDITRAMQHRDFDLVLDRANRMARDWHGGTRIGESLAAFNRHHARHLLSANAALMLLTDGLERSGLDELEHEAARLARHTRRFIWLNPLLRYDGFEPKAAGVRILHAHADDFLPMHSVDQLAQVHLRLQHAGRFDRSNQDRAARHGSAAQASNHYQSQDS